VRMGEASDSELINLSAVAAVAAMRRGEVSAEAYANALLARCEDGRYLNAFITLEPERVREAARAADFRRAAGGALGALHGLPVPIKDSVNTRDLPTTAGTPALRGFQPNADATTVAKLRAAGALVLGKTNLHELSLGWTSNNLAFGPVRNPYDPQRIPGGSSGGTAAAIAARMAPLGVAEDTQGSIRVPAALCGICGFRPTTGRYPSDGTAPITPLFDQIGPHARSIADLALFDATMTGDTRPITPVALAGLRLGIDRGYYFSGLDPEVERIVDEVLARLRAAGAVIVEAEVGALAESSRLIAQRVQLHDLAGAMTRYLRDSGASVNIEQVFALASADVKQALDTYFAPGAPQAISDQVYQAARDVDRPALQRMLANYFSNHGLSAMIFPATMVPATPIGQATRVLIGGAQVPFATAIARNITPGSTAGLPGLVLPAGLTRDTRLPVGLELDGPAGSDRTLLGIGLALEAALDPVSAPVMIRSRL
jgi:indoleacetamide hydrolase